MATFPRTESAAVDKQVTAAQGASTPASGSIVGSMMSGTGEIGAASLASGAVTATKLSAGAIAPGNTAVSAGAISPDQQGLLVGNKTGSDFSAGQLVYVNGYDTTLGVPTVALADAKSPNKRAAWVVPAAIVNGAAGYVVKRWLSAANLNTNSASAVGSPVYSDTSNGTVGGWIVASPAYRWDVVGVVVVKSASVGQIYFDLEMALSGTVIAGNQGDIAAGSIGSAALAAGAVTGTQASTVMATKTVTVPIGTISDSANEETLLIAPFAGTLVAAKLLGKDSLAASDSKYLTFALTNKGQAGAGTTAMLSATASGTTQATGGAAIAAYTARNLPLHATGANAVVAANDALVFTITETGTLVNAVTEGVLRLDFLVTT